MIALSPHQHALLRALDDAGADGLDLAALEQSHGGDLRALILDALAEVARAKVRITAQGAAHLRRQAFA